MQSNLGAALPISAQRLIGTAVGAILGGFVGTYFPANVAAFGVAVFALEVVYAALKVERAAYRYANITLAIVMLVPRLANEWVVAMHRFFEVSIGFVVGLGLSAVWPEQIVGTSPALQTVLSRSSKVAATRLPDASCNA